MRRTRFVGMPVWAAECKCRRFWLANSEQQAKAQLADCPCRSKR